ncbi:hypothetical protein C5C41_06770 [Rathayibacter sp. AY1E9]|uniref:hypothetical protein n=1 Tax=Rathayibacter sp. AY1E9 TaxID=2080556 RepID=UPI000CE84983|nr:hypothetical protein [Rathayibacter sp. AY1E9]PPG53422.1 hypothetical protein C5C41_06770 [Rathayibacter sp. AY1E9]
MQIFEHGSNANMIRPATAGPVIWVGTVDPVGRIDGDLWLTPTSTTTPAVPEIPSGFLHRYEAVDLTSADGTAATTWANRVAGAPAFTASGGPLVKSTSGLRRVLFDGVDDKMDAPIAAVPQAYSKVVLARYVTAAASKVLVGGTSGSNNIASTSTSKVSMTNGTTLAHTATVDSGWHLYTAVSNGASSQIWVDDQIVGGAAGSSGQVELRLAANGGLTSYSNVEVCMVLVYPRSLTPSEVTAIKTYAQAVYPGTV